MTTAQNGRGPGSPSMPFGHVDIDPTDLTEAAPVAAYDPFHLDLIGELFDGALAAPNLDFVRDILARSRHDEDVRAQLGEDRIARAVELLRDLEAA